MEKTSFIPATITLVSLLSILASFLNALCIFGIIKSKKLLQRPSMYLILNLLIVHFLQSSIVFPFYASKKANVDSVEWRRVICDGFRFSYMVTFYAAIWSVLLISIDRFLATWLVMRYREIVTKPRVVITIVISWVYVVSLCLIPFKNEDEKLAFIKNASQQLNSTVTHTKRKCYYQQSAIWTILMLVLNCILPYIIVVLCYQLIIYQIRKIESRSRSTTICSSNIVDTKKRNTSKISKRNNQVTQVEICKNKKITYLAIILSIAYFLLWSPSVIYFILWSVCPDTCFAKNYKISTIEPYIGFTTKYMAFLDALVAPVIYCLHHDEFRKIIKCKTQWKPKRDRTETYLTESDSRLL